MWHLIWIAALLLIAFSRRRRAGAASSPSRQTSPGVDDSQRELQRIAASNKPYPGT